MVSRYSAVVVTLSVVLGTSLGCSPTGPDKIASPKAPLVFSITPSEGLAGVPVTVLIAGSRFQTGAVVRIDNLIATTRVNNEGSISAGVPAHALAGVVDVVVINADGQVGTLTGGFRYGIVTLTPGQSLVAPGGALSVSWVAPGRSNPGDWIGLFKIGDPNTVYVWSQATTGVSGTFTLSAPAQAGEYEFRYLVDDDFIDVRRSSPVTVTTAKPITY